MTDTVRPLTPRQRQIADGIARGLSYAAIGRELGIAEGTVRNYVCEAVTRLRNPHRLTPRALLTLYVVWQKAG